MTDNKTLSISAVAEKTGLTTHVIRAWERRYGAVEPGRSDGNQRLYSEQDVHRLWLLRRAVDQGHSLQEVADRDLDELTHLVEDDGGYDASTADDPVARPEAVARFYRRCLRAVRALDPMQLDAELARASVVLDRGTLVEQLVSPLLEQVGELWSQGALGIAQEHAATEIIRTFLANLTKQHDVPYGAPAIVVATPAGQRHELGAMFCAALAAARRWRVYYLGAGVPADELAEAARQTAARAVALSIVYPPDEAETEQAIAELRDILPSSAEILAGGRSAGAYAPVLDRVGGVRPDGAADFYRVLDRLENDE